MVDVANGRANPTHHFPLRFGRVMGPGMRVRPIYVECCTRADWPLETQTKAVPSSANKQTSTALGVLFLYFSLTFHDEFQELAAAAGKSPARRV